MVLNDNLIKKIKCSKKEKIKCIGIIKKLCYFLEKIRREGLLAVEDEINEITDKFFKHGLKLIIDGTDPDIVKNILLNYLYLSNEKGRVLLEKCIILEGLLSIQNGDNPRILTAKLGSYLNDEGYDLDFENDYLNDYKIYLEKIKDDDLIPDNNTDLLDKFINDFDDRSIQKMLCEIDTQELAKALSGSSGKTKYKIFKNMSNRSGMILKDELDYYNNIYNKKDIKVSQKKIENIFKKLIKTGEIINPYKK